MKMLRLQPLSSEYLLFSGLFIQITFQRIFIIYDAVFIIHQMFKILKTSELHTPVV